MLEAVNNIILVGNPGPQITSGCEWTRLLNNAQKISEESRRERQVAKDNKGYPKRANESDRLQKAKQGRTKQKKATGNNSEQQ